METHPLWRARKIKPKFTDNNNIRHLKYDICSKIVITQARYHQLCYILILNKNTNCSSVFTMHTNKNLTLNNILSS